MNVLAYASLPCVACDYLFALCAVVLLTSAFILFFAQSDGHRVLVFSQWTRLLDLLEVLHGTFYFCFV